jgi:hypothetical protein
MKIMKKPDYANSVHLSLLEMPDGSWRVDRGEMDRATRRLRFQTMVTGQQTPEDPLSVAEMLAAGVLEMWQRENPDPGAPMPDAVVRLEVRGIQLGLW